MKTTLAALALLLAAVAAPAAGASESLPMAESLIGGGTLLPLGLDPFLLVSEAPIDVAAILSLLAWLQSLTLLEASSVATPPVDAAAAMPVAAGPAENPSQSSEVPVEPAPFIPFVIPRGEGAPAQVGVERPHAEAPVAKPSGFFGGKMPVSAAVAISVGSGALGLAVLLRFRPGWLRWLLPLPLLTYTREALLENPMRQRLLQAVEANPGVHFNQLVKDLGLGRGQAEHHLRALEKARLLTRHTAGGYACYFADPAAARDLKGVVNVLKADPARRALQHVLDHPGSRPFDVARAQGLSPDSALYHLRQLAQAQLVSVVIAGEKRLLFPTPAAGRALAALRAVPQAIEAPLVAA